MRIHLVETVPYGGVVCYCQQNAKDWNERCKSHQGGVFGAYGTEMSQAWG